MKSLFGIDETQEKGDDAMYNPMELKGKTILIAGASSGIGKATAITISKLGAKVVLLARREEKLHEVMTMLEGESHDYHVFDLEDIDRIEALVSSLKDKGLKLDGIAYAAAYAQKEVFADLDYALARKSMTINVHAFNELMRQVVTKDVLRSGSSVVVISSTAATHGDDQELAYAMSKAALEAAVRYHAQVLMDKKIRVNAIRPGWVKTPMLDDFLARYGETEYGKKNMESQALGLIEPEEIANLTAFLLSDATTSITATNTLIDGGFLL